MIPARDEATSIARCLASVCRARASAPEVRCSIVVVADSCADETAAIASGTLTGPNDAVVVASMASAGNARSIGTDHALVGAQGPLHRVWLANTDADTVVGPDWLSMQLNLARQGFIAVAGIVGIDPVTVADPLLIDAFTSSYALFPDGTHPHVHGANLGVRADAYRACGGWRSIATGEDHDLWNRVRHLGPTMSSSELSVLTSGRITGRAPAGFASDISELAADVA